MKKLIIAIALLSFMVNANSQELDDYTVPSIVLSTGISAIVNHALISTGTEQKKAKIESFIISTLFSSAFFALSNLEKEQKVQGIKGTFVGATLIFSIRIPKKKGRING